jgi:XTP/dITP diphosphohydrolase
MNTRETQLEAFDRLLGIMEELREMPLGQKQTLQTLRHLTIEETYELGAILDNDLTEVKRDWDCAYCFT